MLPEKVKVTERNIKVAALEKFCNCGCWKSIKPGEEYIEIRGGVRAGNTVVKLVCAAKMGWENDVT